MEEWAAIMMVAAGTNMVVNAVAVAGQISRKGMRLKSGRSWLVYSSLRVFALGFTGFSA